MSVIIQRPSQWYTGKTTVPKMVRTRKNEVTSLVLSWTAEAEFRIFNVTRQSCHVKFKCTSSTTIFTGMIRTPGVSDLGNFAGRNFHWHDGKTMSPPLSPSLPLSPSFPLSLSGSAVSMCLSSLAGSCDFCARKIAPNPAYILLSKKWNQLKRAPKPLEWHSTADLGTATVRTVHTLIINIYPLLVWQKLGSCQ